PNRASRPRDGSSSRNRPHGGPWRSAAAATSSGWQCSRTERTQHGPRVGAAVVPVAIARVCRYREGMRRVLALLAVLLVAVPCARAAVDGRRLRFVGGRLRDQRGREVTLRGVNARAQGIFDVAFADGRLPLEDIPTFDEGDAERMRGFGFNLLRLPISWSALEPEPGRYDPRYLGRIAGIVKLCQRRGILVIVDFHQDAFSKEIGQDGAPRWTLDLLLGPNGYPYLGGPLTDLTA